MKIDRNVTSLNSVADISTHSPARHGVRESRSASELSPVANHVQLSSTTALLPSTNGDFDAARVASIREDISAGRYHVNTAKIADGLLASVRELLGAKLP